MPISERYRKTIANEIDFTVKKMKETPNAEKKLYFFSAAYAIMQRIFNLEYDADLVFAHLILQQTHSHFVDRLRAIKQGKEETVPLVDGQFEKLIVLTKELGDNINQKKEISLTLKKLSELAYTTTGNGHYLMEKGLLKI